MNFNQALYCITHRYPKLTRLRISNILLQSKSPLSFYKSSNRRILKYQEEVLLKHCIYLKGKDLFCFYSSAVKEEQVKPKNSTIVVPPLNFGDLTFEPPITHTEVCNALQICDSIEEQMVSLATTLSLTPDDIENRIYFTKEIESLLKPFFNEVKIQLFGSTLNGFGFKGCDIDMSFETTTHENEKIDYLEKPNVPLVSEVISGKVSPAEICLLPHKEQLVFIHTVLLEYYQESVDPPIFINAYIPLVRFYHDKFGLKCDLTCRNRVAFANTKLLYLFGKLDERVIPLMMTIRYWAKHVELIGKGLMFNTYTVSLLVIHFLQTRDPPILPTAEYLLSLSDSLGIDDMSDTSFMELRSYVPPSENKQTIDELLKDFFIYYLYFDFTRVICPLIGGSISREEFFSNPANKKFRMNTISVQDPMLLSHNVAELVDYKHCKKLFTELLLGSRLLQNSSFLDPSPDKWGVLALFDKPNEFVTNCVSLMKNITFKVPLISKQITENCETENPKLSTAESLLFIMKHVLLLNCKTLKMPEMIKLLEKHDKEIERLKKFVEIKNEHLSDVMTFLQEKYKRKPKNASLHDLRKFDDALMLQEFQAFSSKNKLLLCAECNVSTNVWLGRDSVSLENLPEAIVDDLIEREHFISVHAAKQNEMNISDKKEKIKPFTFIFECYESPDSSESSLLINFRTFQKTSFNPIVGIFLIDYLPKLIERLNE